MKYLSALLLAAFFLPLALSAQTTFSLNPNPSFITATPEDFDVAAKSIIRNTSMVDDSILWVRTEVQLPEGFFTAVCDPIQCYFPGVSSKTFLLKPNQTGPMDVHFYNPNMTTGTGIVHLLVTNLRVPNDTVTGVYIYNTISGTDDPLPTAQVRLFPNPVVEGFSLDHADDVAAVQVFSLTAGLVASFNPSADQHYSIADQPAGHYIVALIASNGKAFQAIEINKQ